MSTFVGLNLERVPRRGKTIHNTVQAVRRSAVIVSKKATASRRVATMNAKSPPVLPT